MANKGGARSGAGRPKGSKNRATSEARARLSELASEYSDAALDALAHVAKHGESANARVSAACALLDRGFGKPVQISEISGPDGGPVETYQDGPTLDASKLTNEALESLMAAKRAGPDGNG